ncbi:HET-domain-containing protein, partial [Saccharata proteae CBS 121410]
YYPLDADQIRLAVIHPGTQSEPLHCSLHTVRLSQWETEEAPSSDLPFPPAYEALSYVWGSTDRPESVIMHHGNNLRIALCGLRKSSDFRVVWVDSLCINQDDLLERGTQVALMWRIYRQASHVVIWLGEEEHYTTDAVFAIHKFATSANIPKKFPFRQPELFIPVELQHAVIAMLRHPWFTRLWVFQESIAAQETTV